MAFEIVNQGQATPQRLRAFLRLVSRRPGLTVPQLSELLQPGAIVENKNATDVVIRTALGLNLARTSDGARGPIELLLAPDEFEDPKEFRRTMRRIILGVVDGDEANYIFNLFTAWYAVLDEGVLRMSGSDITATFNEHVFPASEMQKMNDTKFATAWRPWAAFLGQGWVYSRGSSRVLIPNSYERVTEHVPEWLADAECPLPFSIFMERLSRDCPEMDGGTLFEQARLARQPASNRGRRLSLSLSTALRQLHDRHECQLIHLGDSTSNWTLFPASGHEVQIVTHIAQGSGGSQDA